MIAMLWHISLAPTIAIWSLGILIRIIRGLILRIGRNIPDIVDFVAYLRAPRVDGSNVCAAAVGAVTGLLGDTALDAFVIGAPALAAQHK